MKKRVFRLTDQQLKKVIKPILEEILADYFEPISAYDFIKQRSKELNLKGPLGIAE